MSAPPSAGSPVRRALGRAVQRGVGLVEVMIALAIVTFVAVASANVNVVALTGMHAASFHFALDELSVEMLETLRAHRAEALAGGFDHDFAPDPAPDPAPETDPDAPAPTGSAALVAAWRARVADAVADGDTSVDCDAGSCLVSIAWHEEIDGTRRRQLFRTRTPL